MRIFLIGFMKSGKTTIAGELEKKYNIPNISLDDIFRVRFGPIPSFFKKYGERCFRIKEQEILFRTKYPKNCIIACGGGVVEKWQNIIFIRSRGKVVFLDCNLNTLFDRVDREKRPNWKDKESVEALFYLRRKLYTRYADLVIKNNEISETIERISQYAPNVFH